MVSKRKKKRVSQKHSADFRKVFELPDTEKLIDDFSCAFQRDVLVHGRMYLSQRYVCFHATVFGWVTVVILPFSDIVAIEKKNAALVIPNAISIATADNKYFFASFMSRDRAYARLHYMWENSKSPNPKSVEELLSLPDEVFGEGDSAAESPATGATPLKHPSVANIVAEGSDLDSTTGQTDTDGEDDPGADLSNALSMRSNTTLTHGVHTFSVENNEGKGLDGSAGKLEETERISAVKGKLATPDPANSGNDDSSSNSSNEEIIQIQSATTDSAAATPASSAGGKGKKEAAPQPDPVVEDEPDAPLPSSAKFPCGCEDHYENTHVEAFTVAKTSMKQLYDLVFADGATFFTELFDELGNTDLDVTQWDDSGQYPTRVVTFKQTVKSVLGVKTADVSERQELLWKYKSRMVIKTTASTSGVPYSDHFDVVTLYCIHMADPTTANIHITSEMDWHKSTWLKTTIEKTAGERAREYMLTWCDHVAQTVASSATVAKAPPKRTTKHKNKGKGKSKHHAAPEEPKPAAPAAAATPPRLTRAASRAAVRDDPHSAEKVPASFAVVGCLATACIILAVTSGLLFMRITALETSMSGLAAANLRAGEGARGCEAGDPSCSTTGMPLPDRPAWYLKHHERLAADLNEWEEGLRELREAFELSSSALRKITAAAAAAKETNMLRDSHAECIQAAVEGGLTPSQAIEDTCLGTGVYRPPPSSWDTALFAVLGLAATLGVAGVVLGVVQKLGLM